jgi:hypothetical protein
MEDRSVECGDFTHAHKVPITLSKIGSGSSAWVAVWGRQDVAVWAAGLLVGALGFWSKGLWLPLILDAFPSIVGPLVAIFVLLGLPLLAGFAAASFGLNIRDFPLALMSLQAIVTNTGRTGWSAFGLVKAERSHKFKATMGQATLILPEGD